MNTPKHRHKPQHTSLWFYGKHACFAALANPQRNCLKLLVTRNLAHTLPPLPPPLEPEVTNSSSIEQHLPENAVHQGIALQVRPLKEVALENVLESKILLVLDQVTDPHNVGAILRSAAAFNAGGIITPHNHSPQESAILAKSASGALETTPLIKVTNLSRTLEQLKKHDYWCIGLDGKAKQTLHQTQLPEKIAFVVGAEGKGLRRLTEKTCDLLVKLPINNQNVESLNVSNATAIALYHISTL